MARRRLNPATIIVRIFLPPSRAAFIKETLACHRPVIHMRPSERAMEIGAANILGEGFPVENPKLSLWDWHTVIHALACRHHRSRGRVRVRAACLTLYRWIRKKLDAHQEAAVWMLRAEAAMRAKRNLEAATRAMEAAKAVLEDAECAEKLAQL